MTASSPRRIAAAQSATIAVMRGLPVGEFGDVAVFGEPLDRFIDPTGAEFGEGLAFDGVALTAVPDELDGAELVGEGGEHAAGFDLGQLVRVTDQDDFARPWWAWSRSRASLRVPIIAASSTTTTVRTVQLREVSSVEWRGGAGRG